MFQTESFRQSISDRILSPFVQHSSQKITQPLREKMAVTSPFLDQFRIFLVQINTKGSLLSHVYLNRITQPLGGVMALTVPFLDRFLTFLF